MTGLFAFAAYVDKTVLLD